MISQIEKIIYHFREKKKKRKCQKEKDIVEPSQVQSIQVFSPSRHKKRTNTAGLVGNISEEGLGGGGGED